MVVGARLRSVWSKVASPPTSLSGVLQPFPLGVGVIVDWSFVVQHSITPAPNLKQLICLQVLKEVLGAIKDIKAQSSAVELQYIDLLDRFATRVSTCKPQLKEQYEQQHKQCDQLQETWNQLEGESVQINAALEDVKLEFSSITCQQVTQFQERVAVFFEEFKSAGPGRGNTDLGVGVKLMRETEASLCEILKERDELVLAQKLFELDITAYPELSQVSPFNMCEHNYSVH